MKQSINSKKQKSQMLETFHQAAARSTALRQQSEILLEQSRALLTQAQELYLRFMGHGSGKHRARRFKQGFS